MARDAIGFTDDDLIDVTRNALDASFLPKDVKDAVRAQHFAWITDRPAAVRRERVVASTTHHP